MSIIQNIENFNAQIMATVLPCTRIMYDSLAGASILTVGMHWILLKN